MRGILRRWHRVPILACLVLAWAASPQYETRFRTIRYKILTERGKRYGTFEIPAGKYSRVSNIRARTVKPDGTAIMVSPDQIFEKVVFQVADYKETAWVFHFPAVEQGVILEVRYDRHDYSLLFIDPFYFPGPEFTLRARMTQAIPEDMGYTVLCDLCPNNQQPSVAPWHEAKAKGQMFTMELRDIPGYRAEDLMPPERDASPRLEMLLAHWRNAAIWGLGRARIGSLSTGRPWLCMPGPITRTP